MKQRGITRLRYLLYYFLHSRGRDSLVVELGKWYHARTYTTYSYDRHVQRSIYRTRVTLQYTRNPSSSIMPILYLLVICRGAGCLCSPSAPPLLLALLHLDTTRCSSASAQRSWSQLWPQRPNTWLLPQQSTKLKGLSPSKKEKKKQRYHSCSVFGSCTGLASFFFYRGPRQSWRNRLTLGQFLPSTRRLSDWRFSGNSQFWYVVIFFRLLPSLLPPCLPLLLSNKPSASSSPIRFFVRSAIGSQRSYSRISLKYIYTALHFIRFYKYSEPPPYQISLSLP